MDEILDEDLNYEDKRSSQILLKSLIYLIAMLFAGSVLIWIEVPEPHPAWGYFIYPIGAILFMIFVAIPNIIGILIKDWNRKRREKQSTNTKIQYDPLWYQILESSFSFWIILVLISIVGSFL